MPMPPNYAQVMNGLAITRYHTKRTLRTQTVADHSARIAAILCYLFDGAQSGALLTAAIYHDVSEFVTGDIPSPVKRKNPALREELNRITTEYEVQNGLRVQLTEQEAAALKFADNAEGCQYCIDEVCLGNRQLMPTLGRYLEYISNMPALGSPGSTITARQMVLVQNYSEFYYMEKARGL